VWEPRVRSRVWESQPSAAQFNALQSLSLIAQLSLSLYSKRFYSLSEPLLPFS